MISKVVFTLLFLSSFSFAAIAQKGIVKGVIKNKASGETLIGANVLIGDASGTTTDLDGNYSLELNEGDYVLKVSYVGCQPQEKKIKVISGKTIPVNFELSGVQLSEVEVVSDLAKTRETPVAFTEIPSIKIQEQLASRDIPMMLNKTPGVYATQQGGGDGDSRINVRGFSQRNVAVMFDGIPMNDMENGWVYWSNWFGTDNITRTVQVQRGLGASKLALPSVGGTINIISKGIESKRAVVLKQEFTSNDDFTGGRNSYRTTLSLTTGKLKGGWGITAAGSVKRGEGWVDNTGMKMYSWFFKLEKASKGHLLSLTAFGAPQAHSQRSDKQNMATYDTETALKYEIDTSKYVERGLRYNQNWGYLKRGEGAEDTSLVYREKVSETYNYFHKPVFALKDFWTISDRLYWSNIVYASYGFGGGSYSLNVADDSSGQKDFQSAYNGNVYKGNVDPLTGERKSSYYIRTPVNNHRWIGYLSTVSYTLTKQIKISGGLDLRTYKGEHQWKVYDLLGGEYVLNSVDLNSSIDKKYLGDIAGKNYDSQIRWGGLFGLAEYTKGKLSIFLNASGINSGSNRIDYLRRKDVIVNGKKYREVVGTDEMFFKKGEDTLVYHQSAGTNLSSIYWHKDTVFVVRKSGALAADTSYLVNPETYTSKSKEAHYSSSGWKWVPGFTSKVGVNYNMDDHYNVFTNIGYLSRPPRFDNVVSRNNSFFHDLKNENIKSAEVGTSANFKRFSTNLNSYYTIWENKPADFPFTYRDKFGNEFFGSINGINALHKGIEIEIDYRINSWLSAELSGSEGEWRWTSSALGVGYDDNGDILDSVSMDATGVRVGDAAQTTAALTLRFEPVRHLYFAPSYNFFGNNYSNFNPEDLKWGNARNRSWQLPDYYLIDFNAGYGFKFSKIHWDLRCSVLNVLDVKYISDAQNNSFGAKVNDAASAGVFFGLGRRMNFSLTARF